MHPHISFQSVSTHHQPNLWEQCSPCDGSVPGDSCRVTVQAGAGRAAAAAAVTIELVGMNAL